MNHILNFLALMLFISVGTVYGQFPDDSTYQSLGKNKGRSIFNALDSGQFDGKANGYFELIKSDGDTIVLDFMNSAAVLDIEQVEPAVYDNNTKKYKTSTTSGKASVVYRTHMLANSLEIRLDGQVYEISMMDGAYDLPISGLSFNYCGENNIEYLTLFATQRLEMTDIAGIMEQENMSYSEAKNRAKIVTVLPGSTLILTIRKTLPNKK